MHNSRCNTSCYTIRSPRKSVYTYNTDNRKEEEEEEERTKKRKPGVGELYSLEREGLLYALEEGEEGARQNDIVHARFARWSATSAAAAAAAHILDRVEVSAAEIDKSVLGAVYSACACVSAEISTYFGTPCKREIKNIARRLRGTSSRGTSERAEKGRRIRSAWSAMRDLSRASYSYTLSATAHTAPADLLRFSSRSSAYLQSVSLMNHAHRVEHDLFFLFQVQRLYGRRDVSIKNESIMHVRHLNRNRGSALSGPIDLIRSISI
uniref:Uncharacterized protein n=1 Tax=Trichogramma kaykai TaxID=54128 RepID=A0ABD2XFT1_9HYME